LTTDAANSLGIKPSSTGLGRCATAGGLSLLVIASSVLTTSALCAPTARADVVAYLVNVTVRPGYNFPNADAAVNYGHEVCDKIGRGQSYGDLIGDVKSDFQTSDESSWIATTSSITSEDRERQSN
jgi:hypothetical protein